MIEKLLALNVSDHIEKKNNLSYLSWAWAWQEALKADPMVTYQVQLFGDKCYMDINGTAMVWVTVTMFNKPITCQLPVMDHRNKAIPNPDAFQVNTAIMRCMTKALALHGLGLFIYAGEDLPEVKVEYLNDEQIANIESLAGEVGADITKLTAHYKVDRLTSIPNSEYHKIINTLERKRG